MGTLSESYTKCSAWWLTTLQSFAACIVGLWKGTCRIFHTSVPLDVEKSSSAYPPRSLQGSILINGLLSPATMAFHCRDCAVDFGKTLPVRTCKGTAWTSEFLCCVLFIRTEAAQNVTAVLVWIRRYQLLLSLGQQGLLHWKQVSLNGTSTSVQLNTPLFRQWPYQQPSTSVRGRF